MFTISPYTRTLEIVVLSPKWHPLDEQTILFLFDKDKDNFLIYQIFFNFFLIFLRVCFSHLFYKDTVTFLIYQIFFNFFLFSSPDHISDENPNYYTWTHIVSLLEYKDTKVF